jgi:hypothetical protein
MIGREAKKRSPMPIVFECKKNLIKRKTPPLFNQNLILFL